ncbi:hypothetical protein BD413DRAFT_599166 [Trametes elegans]|nr:hypothetical protein BD413DRAFT_599166 [Trametes elegans]
MVRNTYIRWTFGQYVRFLLCACGWWCLSAYSVYSSHGPPDSGHTSHHASALELGDCFETSEWLLTVNNDTTSTCRTTVSSSTPTSPTRTRAPSRRKTATSRSGGTRA